MLLVFLAAKSMLNTIDTAKVKRSMSDTYGKHVNSAQNNHRQQPTNARTPRRQRPVNGDFAALPHDQDVGQPFRRN